MVLVVTVLGTAAWAPVPASAFVVPGGTVMQGRAPFIPAAGSNPNGGGKGHGHRGGLTATNWAGYVDTGATFSGVDGEWVEPTATCPTNATQQAAFWVGIGGFVSGDSDIEQIGTDSDCLKGKGNHGGGPNYYAWYQMVPSSVVILPAASYPVAAGETFESSVTLSGTDSYTLTLVDVGHWTFSTVQSQASQPPDESAEWIAEAPQSCNSKGKCKVLPLADFTSVGFSGASANGEAISGSGLTDTEVTMTTKNGKTVKAQPSALGGSGSSFSVTWEHN